MSSELRVAIITGASSGTYFTICVIPKRLICFVGIGKASAVALAKAGWSVVLFARRVDKLKEAQEQCPDASKVLLVVGDVSSEKDVANLFQEAVKQFGKTNKRVSKYTLNETLIIRLSLRKSRLGL